MLSSHLPLFEVLIVNLQFLLKSSDVRNVDLNGSVTESSMNSLLRSLRYSASFVCPMINSNVRLRNFRLDLMLLGGPQQVV